MPNNNQHNDAELSALLRQAEPPKSPEHLDERILRYARENAPTPVVPPSFQMLERNRRWLHRNWMAAAATISIAVVAVSVTLPVFNPAVDDLGPERKRADDTSLAASKAESVPAPSTVEQVPVPQALTLERPERQAPESATSRSRSNDVTPASPLAMREIEETVVSGAFVQRAGVSINTPDETSILVASETTLIAGENRTLFLGVLMRVLLGPIVSEPNQALLRTDESATAQSLQAAFREIENSPAVDSARERYATERAAITAIALPESLDAAMALLDSIEL